MRKIVLCADDYGMSFSISRAIISLAETNRISATSCLVDAADWSGHAKLLKESSASIDIGLHFDLTNNNKYTLAGLIYKANLRLLKQHEIVFEFERQLDRFIEHVGKLPDFIDGHQHIHQFPVICDAILNVYQRRLITAKPYLRYVNSNFCSLNMKQLIIAMVSDWKYANKLLNFGIECNQNFAGIYNFSSNANYAQLFPAFLRSTTNGSLLMCHPSFVSDTTKEPIAVSRYSEYQYFSSEQFLLDCQNAGVKITRWAEI